MTDIPLPKALVKAKAELDALRDEYKVIHDKLIPAGENYRKKFSKFALEQLEKTDDKMAHILSPQFCDVSVEHLNATDKYLWGKYGTGTSGMNSLTHQRLLQLTFRKNDTEHNAKMRQLIVDALPYLIPFSAGMKDHYNRPIDVQLHGFCMFGILEHGLSEYAAINIYFSHEHKVLVSQTRYSRTTYSQIMDFDEGLDYILQNHYYGDSDSSSDED